MQGGSLLPEGVFVETVSVACRGERPLASMPVGLLRTGEAIRFRVYSARFREAVRAADRLVFYSPRDPLEFLESIERRVEARDRCRPPRSAYTVLVVCRPVSLGIGGSGEEWFECVDARVEPGLPAPYTRAYGCLVELLVLLTKVWAGVAGCDALEYARFLAVAVGRSDRTGRLAAAAGRVLGSVEEALRARCPGMGEGALQGG